jgi:hypothetical protein
MNKSKILIQIFPMLKEIDYLERTLLFLKQNSLFIDKDKYHIILDITLPISDYLIDWNKSILKEDYFINKFNHLKKYYGNWSDECYFNIDKNVKGLLDCFINNLNKYPDIDDIILLETDVIFGPYTLSLFLESSIQIKSKSPNYIITSEYVKMWDNSWDIVVNSKFLNESFTFRNSNDPINDTYFITNDETYLKPLIFNNKKYFKFGGGWFTLYSKSFIDKIDFPKTLEGYGGLDNYIMMFCEAQSHIVTQYKIENLITTDYHNNTTYYDNYIFSIDRKQDLYQKNHNIMINHFKNKFNNL